MKPLAATTAHTVMIRPAARRTPGAFAAYAEFGRFMLPIVTLLVFWELAVRAGWIASNIFPSPSMIFARASEQLFSTGPEQGMLFKHIGASLYRAISAFALSVLIGIPLGFCLGLMPSVHKWTSPILSVMLPLPAVAWTPILLVAFGQGDRTIITVCFLGAFFPVLYSTIQGVKAVSKQSIWVVRSMGGKRRHVLLNVLLPSCLPALISGLKLGMAHSWRTLVAAEMLAAISTGLGYMIFAARSYMDVSTMFVGIALLALIGMAIEYGIFGVLEQRTIRKWHGASRMGGSK
ncbi:ABC transporter permease [Bordetella parapertussis]|uniref:ABC transporter permease n=4 Tax=Bordetella TaxID=517 RepID=A0ABU5X3T6_BORPP|nr:MULTISPECIES: ABC transporter permease [Bordetella]KAK64380.1 ABC transporter, permease protein [Bordetella bronchiseptica 980-2]AMG89654.1 ABC transporter permease [Bordetella bronchiseptica]AOB40143.1 taurine ABC transporter permease [Bordetella parapertussis]AUL44160.1 taurine ABC transporter permease [Bordetella parapertussis]AWP64064.1 taurine ABC transporter permease [Bordetella parapertussis]